jgi:hypothetical protein
MAGEFNLVPYDAHVIAQHGVHFFQLFLDLMEATGFLFGFLRSANKPPLYISDFRTNPSQ